LFITICFSEPAYIQEKKEKIRENLFVDLISYLIKMLS